MQYECITWVQRVMRFIRNEDLIRIHNILEERIKI